MIAASLWALQAEAITTEAVYRFASTSFPLGRGPLVEGRGGVFYGISPAGGDDGHGFLYRLGTNGVIEPVLSFAAGRELVGKTLRKVRSGRILALQNGAPGPTLVQVTDDEKLVSIAEVDPTIGFPYEGGLVEGNDGALYGVTDGKPLEDVEDEPADCGSFVRLSPTGVWNVIAPRDCDVLAGDVSGLTAVPDGSFYGTSSEGGAEKRGSVFRLLPDGSVTTVVSFNGLNGAGPTGGVVLAPDGNLYGTTTGIDFVEERSLGLGTVFRLTLAGTLTTIHTFSFAPGHSTRGAFPRAPLVVGAGGVLYGTTSDIDADRDDTGFGSVFVVNPNGAVRTVFHDGSLAGIDAARYPEGLVATSDGSTYGFAQVGRFGAGLVFRLNPSGTASEVISFPHPTGRSPRYLVPASDGGFLVATDAGGTTGDGTISRIESDGRAGSIASFDSATGRRPSSLIRLTNDVYVGTTETGGAHGAGTVFRHSGSRIDNVHSFSPAVDGRSPLGLIQTRGGRVYGLTQGNLYGPTEVSLSEGTVFELSREGTVATLVRFRDNDGRSPARLVEGIDGNLYGITSNGGAANVGTVFRMTSDGAITFLHRFSVGDGASPNALVMSDTGDLIGTAAGGGIGFGFGVVFRIDTQGRFRVLLAFPGSDPTSPIAIPKGRYPSDLLRTRDGRIFGVCNSGGFYGEGTLFEVTATGKVITLGSFSLTNLLSDLVEGEDGVLYGLSSRAELLRIRPRVALRTLRTSRGIDLSWPREAEGYQVQYTESLNPVVWRSVAPTSRGSYSHVFADDSAVGPRVFRLMHAE